MTDITRGIEEYPLFTIGFVLWMLALLVIHV